MDVDESNNRLEFIKRRFLLSNIESSGFTVFCIVSAIGSTWLEGKTASLSGGGQAVPYGM